MDLYVYIGPWKKGWGKARPGTCADCSVPIPFLKQIETGSSRAGGRLFMAMTCYSELREVSGRLTIMPKLQALVYDTLP